MVPIHIALDVIHSKMNVLGAIWGSTNLLIGGRHTCIYLSHRHLCFFSRHFEKPLKWKKVIRKSPGVKTTFHFGVFTFNITVVEKVSSPFVYCKLYVYRGLSTPLLCTVKPSAGPHVYTKAARARKGIVHYPAMLGSLACIPWVHSTG